MPTLPVEFGYAVIRLLPAEFSFCVLQVECPIYSSTQIEKAIEEFNKDLEFMVQQDQQDRMPINTTGSNTGLFKRELGLASYQYAYLFEHPSLGNGVELFKSSLNDQSMVFEDANYGKDISKLGIFLCWLAERDKWPFLSAVVLTPDLGTNDTPELLGIEYENGFRLEKKVQLIAEDEKFQISLKEYLQKEDPLKLQLKAVGGVKAGASKIATYITDQRMSDALSPKEFKDLAVQTQALLDGWGVQLPPIFSKYCKLSGIIP